MTVPSDDPTVPTPVTGDVPATEPPASGGQPAPWAPWVAAPPAAPVAPQPPAAAPEAAPEAPAAPEAAPEAPAVPEAAAPPAEPAGAPPAAPAPVTADVPATEPPPAPAAEPPAAPPPAPAPPAAPAPVAAGVPAPAPPPAVAAPEPTATVDAGLAAAAATTTELAPHPAVPAEDESPWDPPRRYDEPPRGGRRPVLVVAVTMVAVVLLGALGWVASRPVLDWRRADRLAARRAEALRAARTLALNIGSLDHKNLDRDLTRIAESTTGEAREEFDAKILKNDAYKALVKENEATLTSTVQRIGLEPCGSDDTACRDGKRVVVLVFYDQESRNKLRPTPRVDRNRVALTLVRSHGKWLISDVAVV